MHKTEVLHSRMRPDLKRAAEAVLHKVGLTSSDAISLFFHQIVLNKGLPFEVRIPNKTTRQVLREARAGKNMKSYASVDEMRRAIEGRSVKMRKKT